MAGKKREKPERFFAFEVKLWGVTARVAAMSANAARRMLAARHHFREAWEQAVTENLGWDDERGWRARAQKGGDVLSIVSAPRAGTPPVPEKALLSGERDERSSDADCD